MTWGSADGPSRALRCCAGALARMGDRNSQHGAVTTVTDCRLLIPSAEDFTQLAGDDPSLTGKLADLVDQHRGHGSAPRSTEEDLRRIDD